MDSTRSQSYGRWEQIVFDDGSNDRTPDIVSGYDDPRIRLIRGEHRGVSSLGDIYNEALNAASGEYVAVLEGDDSWPRSKLEDQLPVFQENDVLLSWGMGILVDPSGRRIGRVRPADCETERMYFNAQDLLPRLILDNIIIPSSGVLVRREALSRLGGFQGIPGVPFVDLPTWIALLLRMGPLERFAYLDRHVVNYRLHPNQVSRRYQDAISAATRVAEFLLEEFSRREISQPRVPRDELRRIVIFYQAREAISLARWQDASRMLRGLWGDMDQPLKRAVLIASISSFVRVNLSRFGFELGQRIPMFAKLFKTPHGSRRHGD